MAKIRARYAVKGPKMENVTYTKASMNPETNSLDLEKVTEERECYWVMFPQGHSIRVTSFDELKRMGFHLKPRMVDMETGDIVDVGGDPYDFANNPQVDVIADEEEEVAKPSRSKQSMNKE